MYGDSVVGMPSDLGSVTLGVPIVGAEPFPAVLGVNGSVMNPLLPEYGNMSVGVIPDCVIGYCMVPVPILLAPPCKLDSVNTCGTPSDDTPPVDVVAVVAPARLRVTKPGIGLLPLPGMPSRVLPLIPPLLPPTVVTNGDMDDCWKAAE